MNETPSCSESFLLSSLKIIRERITNSSPNEKLALKATAVTIAVLAAPTLIVMAVTAPAVIHGTISRFFSPSRSHAHQPPTYTATPIEKVGKVLAYSAVGLTGIAILSALFYLCATMLPTLSLTHSALLLA